MNHQMSGEAGRKVAVFTDTQLDEGSNESIVQAMFKQKSFCEGSSHANAFSEKGLIKHLQFDLNLRMVEDGDGSGVEEARRR